MVIWKSRRKLAAGEITEAEFFERACASATSVGPLQHLEMAVKYRGVARLTPRHND
jgi:dihydroxy-acid dehydratase